MSVSASVIEVVKVGSFPEGFAYSPEANLAIVANSASDDVTFISFGAPVTFPEDPIALEDSEVRNDDASPLRILIADTIESLRAEAETLGAQGRKGLRESAQGSCGQP